MDELLEIIFELCFPLIIFYIIYKLSNNVFKWHNKLFLNKNKIIYGMPYEECVQLIGRPQTISYGNSKSSYHTYELGWFTKASIYVGYDNNWRVSYISITER